MLNYKVLAKTATKPGPKNGLKKPRFCKNLKSPNFRFLGFPVKFYTDHI